VFSCSFGEFRVSEPLSQQIDLLQQIYRSDLDPQGRAFVPLADAYRRDGDLARALEIIQKGLDAHPDFASAHMVAGWVHRSLSEPDDAMRSFERVLDLDEGNSLARAAIAELIDDQRARAYKDKMAAKGSEEPAVADIEPVPADVEPVPADVGPVLADVGPVPAAVEDERPVVPVSSLAPSAPAETVADGDQRPVVPVDSLAPAGPTGAPTAETPPAEVADAPAADADDRPVVPIDSLAPPAPSPDGPDGPVVPIDSLAPPAPSPDGPDGPVVSVQSLAPDSGDDESHGVDSGDDASHGVDSGDDASQGVDSGDDSPKGAETPGSVELGAELSSEIQTETLAELYAGQGATEEAIEVYRKLLASDPDNESLAQRLAELESLDPDEAGSPPAPEVGTVTIESLAPDG
jgi:tetratricopeptide (TPR) repeat protein